MLLSTKIRIKICNKTSLNSNLLPSLEFSFNKTSSSVNSSDNDFYYYLVMSQLDSYRNEAIEEVLREKSLKMNDIEFKKKIFVLNCPYFIKELDLLPYIKETTFFGLNHKKIIDSQLNEKTGLVEDEYYFTAIVSTDQNAISTLKLRLGFFENMDAIQNEIQFHTYRDVIPTPKAIHSIGFTGHFCLNSSDPSVDYCYLDPTLNSNPKKLHPSITKD